MFNHSSAYSKFGVRKYIREPNLVSIVSADGGYCGGDKC